MSKEIKDENNVETEIKVAVIKKESFWKKNHEKITRALEVVGASVLSFVAGMITSDLLFQHQMTSMKTLEEEPADVLPFETNEVSE